MNIRKLLRRPNLLVPLLALAILGGITLFSPSAQQAATPDASKSVAKLFKQKPSKKQSTQAPVAQALLTPSPSQTATLPVVHKSGTLTTNETWTAGNVYMIDNTIIIPDGITLTIDQGVIIKSSAQTIQVTPGGSLNVQGSLSDPAIFTSYRDDSVGGDSNADGASVGSVNDYTYAISAQGGNVAVSHAIMQYGNESIERTASGGSAVVEDSLIKSRVRAEFQTITLQRNEINVDIAGGNFAVNLYASSDPSTVALAGSNANTFTGANKVVYLGNAAIASGSTWNIDGSSSAVIYASGTNVYGMINLSNGAIVKTADTAFNVYDDGSVNVYGTTSSPINFTSLKDDSLGGDSNGDGPSVGASNDYGIALNCQGGDINISHARFQYANIAIDKLHDGAATVTDSTFNSSVRSMYPIILQNNTFDTHGYAYAIDAYGSRDLSTISLSGANANHFTGNKTVYVGNAWVAAGTTWSVDASSNAVLLGGSVALYGTLNMGSGTIFKTTQGSEGLRAEQGGQLNVAGSTTEPVIFTSYKDDTLGGDTNLDGASSGSTNDYGNAIGVYGGTTSIAHAKFQYGSLAIDKLYNGDAQITDSIFNSAVRSHSPITLERNTFDVAPGAYSVALEIGGNNSPDLISLDGPNKNIFLGNNASRVILSGYGATLQSGKGWVIDGSTNAVVYSTGINVYGDLTLQNGAILKDVNSNAVSVYDGGSVIVTGSSTNPVIFTGYKDDSIGGDSNNDGSSTGSPQDGGTFFNMSGGSLNVSFAKFMNAGLAIDQQYASTVTVNDSVFQIPVRARYDLHLARNQFSVGTSAVYGAGLDIQGSADPSGVILSGSDKNIFNGNGFGKAVIVTNVNVPSDKTWEIDGSSGAVIVSSDVRVYGTLKLTGDVISKVSNGTAFNIKDGGVLEINGGTGQAIITSYKDDSLGGDTNNDAASTPASGDYGTALELNTGGTIKAEGLKVEYAGGVLANYGGSATFEATDIDSVGNGLYTPGGYVTFRGVFTNVSGKAIQACDWNSTNCSVDASYSDWGSAGPTTSLVCGQVTVAPWKNGSTTVNGGLFASSNCNGSTPTPDVQLNTAATNYASRMSSKEIDCSGGFQDACQAMQTAQQCLSAATTLAASTSSFPLPNGNAYDQPAQWGGMLADNASAYIQSQEGEIPILSAASFATQLLGAVQTIMNVANAYNTCAP